MASPMADNVCCLPSCLIGKVEEKSGLVEVRAFEPPSGLRASLQLTWGPGGEAVFHSQCWRQVMREYSGKAGGTIGLSSLDRALVEEASKTVEFHDSDETVNTSAQHIAQLILQSQHAIAFTGAGISTAAGIGDFRGINGKWTDNDKVKSYGAAAKPKARRFISSELRPTYTHEAIAKLVDMELLKFVISQNTDGLHRLSAVPKDKLSELHGNCFVEKCESCGTLYERRQAVGARSTLVPARPCPNCRINHRTGRRCDNKDCRGYLMNTIVNFGDHLLDDVMQRAEQHARQNDLVLCLGTTLRVSPANQLVTMGTQPPRIVLCNRQSTPYDGLCEAEVGGPRWGARVFGDCDRLMRLVMSHILGAVPLAQWEGGRGQRMQLYEQQRC